MDTVYRQLLSLLPPIKFYSLAVMMVNFENTRVVVNEKCVFLLIFVYLSLCLGLHGRTNHVTFTATRISKFTTYRKGEKKKKIGTQTSSVPLKHASENTVNSDQHNLYLSRIVPLLSYRFHGPLFLAVSHISS